MKKTILCIGLCLILLLSGCAHKSGMPSETTSTPTTDPTSGSSQPGKNTSAPADIKRVDWSKIQGKIRDIYPAGGSKVLILADQITLYDLAAGNTVATASKEALNGVHFWTLDNGYAIVGGKDPQGADKSSGFSAGEAGPQFCVIFYDTSLKNRSALDLSKLLGKKEALMNTESIAVSSDCNRIAYATIRGLYLYDRQSDQRTTLIDLTPEDNKARSGISIIEQIGFTNDDKSIAFKAQSFDVPAVTDKPSFDTIGTINTDGTGLTNKKIDGYTVKELSTYDSRLLLAEDFTTADGRVMVMDSKSGSKQIYDLTDKEEGGNICASDTGRYFASSVAAKTGWMVRIYDAETGKLVKEQSISNDGQELYGVNDPVLRIADKTRTCFVLLGSKQDSVDTKVEMVSF